MEFRHLKYFVAVAEMGSVSRAAEKLFIAQPPLSLQIKQLEDEVGVPLLLRYPRGVRLTAAGAAFLEEAKDLLDRAERAKQRARHKNDVAGGMARVAFVPSAGHTVIPRLVRRLRARLPECELDLREMITSQQVQALVHDEIDIGLLRPPMTSSRLTVTNELSDPFCLAIPDGHALWPAPGPSICAARPTKYSWALSVTADRRFSIKRWAYALTSGSARICATRRAPYTAYSIWWARAWVLPSCPRHPRLWRPRASACDC